MKRVGRTGCWWFVVGTAGRLRSIRSCSCHVCCSRVDILPPVFIIFVAKVVIIVAVVVILFSCAICVVASVIIHQQRKSVFADLLTDATCRLKSDERHT